MEFVHPVRRLLLPLHHSMRRRKVKMFFDRMVPRPSDSLLDIGGAIGMSGEFAELYEYFPNMTTLNLEPDPHGCGHATFVPGDARKMPFADSSFDYVFSNAVIEHVGEFAEQKKMADEIVRVAKKGFFIATPNSHFPIDPHSYLPFFHLLSTSARKRLAAGLLKSWIGEYEAYWMLSKKQMRQLFPTAWITTTLDRTSIIAYWCSPILR